MAASERIDRDRMVAKIATIDRCLARIKEVRSGQRRMLLPVDIADISSLNLQRSIQAAIDLATHVVSAEGYGTPDSVDGVFSLLNDRRVIDTDLAIRLRRLVAFRNIAVHEYQTLDPAILDAILDRHLGDLKTLARQIVDRFLR